MTHYATVSAGLTHETVEVDRELLRALDRAVDDLEAGHGYSVDEGMKKVQLIREGRKKTTT